MSCSLALTKPSIRALSRVLQCLHRMGSELSVESLPEKLILRTLAPSHAAYALVILKSDFFEANSFVNRDAGGQVIIPQTQGASEAASEYIKCKMHLKQIQLAFRHSNISQSNAHTIARAQACNREGRVRSRLSSRWQLPAASPLPLCRAVSLVFSHSCVAGLFSPCSRSHGDGVQRTGELSHHHISSRRNQEQIHVGAQTAIAELSSRQLRFSCEPFSRSSPACLLGFCFCVRSAAFPSRVRATFCRPSFRTPAHPTRFGSSPR